MLDDRSHQPSGIDWSQPILHSEDVRPFLNKPTKEAMKKWCLAHREFCRSIGDGSYGLHRDAFIAWFTSGGPSQQPGTRDTP